LVARPRANLAYARQSLEQALDALLAALTVEPLITGEFKRDGLQHT
jgi:hypothetical protein